MADHPAVEPINTNEQFSDTQSIIADYVFTTTIHGARDLHQSNKFGSRVMWIFFLLCCFGIFSYESYQICIAFDSGSTVIQIEPFTPGIYPYPLVRYCPRAWVDFDKIKKLEINESVFLYALSLLHQVIVPDSKIGLYSNKSQAEMEEEAQKMLENHSWNSYFDFYLAIAKNVDDVITCDQCKSQSPSPTATSIGVCYDLEFEDFPWDTQYYADLACVGFTTKETENQTDGHYHEFYDTVFATDIMYIGEHKMDFFGWDPLFLNTDRHHTVKLRPIHKKKLPVDGKNNCFKNPPDTYSDKMCCTECAEMVYGPACWKFNHLGHISKDKKPPTFPWHSSLYAKKIKEETKLCENETWPILQDCITNCLYPCDIWEFDKAVQLVEYCLDGYQRGNKKTLKTGGHRIDFIYLGTEGTFMEELPMMTTNIFISNMGCQLGLWFGASAVSIWQLLLFVVNLIRHFMTGEMRRRT